MKRYIPDTAHKLSVTEKRVFEKAALHFQFQMEKGRLWYESYCRNGIVSPLVEGYCLGILTGSVKDVVRGSG